MSKYRLAFLLVPVALAGCGGGSTQSAPVASPLEVAIGGVVTGLPAGRMLILTNGSVETLAIRSSGNFAFTKKIPVGSDYSVSIWGNSSGLACTLSNGSGQADSQSGGVSNIQVACVPGAIALENFFVGVTVSGLAPGNSVTFTNNGRDMLTATDNGLSIFLSHYAKEAVYSGRPGGYEVAVQSNPSGQTCSVSDASGAFGLDQAVDFVDVIAVCK
jgi:hypothetical protein